MTVEQKYKWALTGLVVMVLLNAIILATLWMNRPVLSDSDRFLGNNKVSPPIHQQMQNQLGLTGGQRERFTEIRREHIREMRALRRVLDDQRKEYLDLILDDNTESQESRDSLLTELTHQFSEIERSMYHHMTEMKNILDEEQQAKFQQMMQRGFTREHHRGRGNNR